MVVDPIKIKNIVDWPVLRSVKELKGFLGLIGYYRKFVKGYGAIAQPLTQLLKKNSYHWTEEANHAFKNLKVAMTSPPVLALPNFSKEFVIETGASGSAVGVVLMQDGYPIAFLSQALKERQLAWSTYKKEMYAIILVVAKWRSYLLGNKFLIRTDHISLKHVDEQRIYTAAQHKWLLKLLGGEFNIEYKIGAANRVVDALSRKGSEISFMTIEEEA